MNNKKPKKIKNNIKAYSENPGPLLRKALQKCREIHTDVCSDLDITSMQASAIYTLSKMGPITQAKLGKAIGMEPSNVHGLTRRLMDKKLIILTADEQDARASAIKLTSSGEIFARKIARRSKQISDKFLEPITKNEGKILRELLIRLIDQ